MQEAIINIEQILGCAVVSVQFEDPVLEKEGINVT